MNEYDEEEIVEALKNIKAVCASVRVNCKPCPFCATLDNGYHDCLIQSIPREWKIADINEPRKLLRK